LGKTVEPENLKYRRISITWMGGNKLVLQNIKEILSNAKSSNGRILRIPGKWVEFFFFGLEI